MAKSYPKIFMVIVAILLVGFSFAGTANAVEGEDDWLGIELTIQDVDEILNGIACWLLRVSMVLTIIFIIIAGLRFMTAGGDPTRYANAKKNFTYALIGVVVIVGVYEIIATVANAVGADYSFIPLVCGS